MTYALPMGSRCVALLVTTASLLALAPACALAGSGDAAATRTYIQANYALVQSGGTRLARARSILHNLLRQVEGECPQAAKGSPQNGDSTELSEEVIGTMVTSAYRPDLPAIDSYIRATAHLQWSNHSLTSAVRAYVGKLKAIAALAPPKLCADVAAWRAGGYATLPASTIGFDQQFEPNWVALGELPALLKSTERPEETGLLRRSNQLEQQLTEFEAEAAETWRELMNELDLEP